MKAHVREGCIQLLPRDVRLMRQHLLHQPPGNWCISLHNLQVYSILLVGINLFLRSEELLKLNFTDFVPAYTFFQVETRKIQCLLFKVQGKSVLESETLCRHMHWQSTTATYLSEGLEEDNFQRTRIFVDSRSLTTQVSLVTHILSLWEVRASRKRKFVKRRASSTAIMRYCRR